MSILSIYKDPNTNSLSSGVSFKTKGAELYKTGLYFGFTSTGSIVSTKDSVHRKCKCSDFFLCFFNRPP